MLTCLKSRLTNRGRNPRNKAGRTRNTSVALRIEGLETRNMMSGLGLVSADLATAVLAGSKPGASNGTGSALVSSAAAGANAASAQAIPAAPSFTATPASSSQINLAWKSVSQASGYYIDIVINGAWKQIGNYGAGTTGCQVIQLAANTTYMLDVGTYNSSGTAWAASQNATTLMNPPAAPTLAATATSSTQITLSWNSVSGASGYLVDQLVNGSWQQIGNLSSGNTTCTVSPLSPNTTYTFDVAAYNNGGTVWAASKSATTRPIDHPLADTAYQPASGSLFGANGPLYTDVHQGNMGDCWLLSSLAEVAYRDPADIKSMFTAEGTTTENGATVSLYQVRFYNPSGVAQYVTVDSELPSGGSEYDNTSNGVLWVALAEKAYAQANGAGFVQTNSPGSDSYAALNGADPAWALQAISGKSASHIAVNPANVAAAWNAGDLIVLGSSSNANDNLIVGDTTHGTHAYAMVGYTGSGATPFELFNPWNDSTVVNQTTNYYGHQVYDGTCYISGSMISSDFANVSVGAGAAPALGGAGQAAHNTSGSLLADAGKGAGQNNSPSTTAMAGAAAPAQPQGQLAADHLFAEWADGADAGLATSHVSRGAAADASMLAQMLGDQLVDGMLPAAAI